MQISSILPNIELPMHRKKRRGPKLGPVAAGVAGLGALALVSYKKRSANPETSAGESASADTSALDRHVADMVALDQEMAKSFRKQLDGDAILSLPQARPILTQAADAFEKQAAELEIELGGGGSGPSAVMKKLLAVTLGAVAPLLSHTRAEPVSRLLRDDVLSLRLAAVSSSMLHTSANAAGNGAVAVIAKDGGDSFSLLAEELEGVLPAAVTMEFEERHDQAPDPSTTNDSADQVDLAFAPSNGAVPS